VEIIPATNYVLGDEKALYLYEMNLPSPLGQRRRYEIIWVVRDGKRTEHRRDLGKVTQNEQLRIPSYMEHTVSELREMANQLRSAPLLDPRDLAYQFG